MRSWITILGAVAVASQLTGCETDRAESANHVLSGYVIIDDRPAKNVTVIVRGPDEKECSGLTDATGFYRIENVPTGMLTFLVSTLAPPPPPSVKASTPVLPPDATIVPIRYSRPGNELQFNHTGGNQTYDINIR